MNALNTNNSNVFSVDVEEFFHGKAFADRPQRQWEDLPAYAVESTMHIADLLRRHQYKATFFVVGWFAQKHPDLIKKLHGAGHEIASHSFRHLHEPRTEAIMLEDIKAAKGTIEDILGSPVYGYGSPSWLSNNTRDWYFDVPSEAVL